MADLALMEAFDPAKPFVYREGRWITRGAFAADVMTNAARLPTRRYAINVCSDRYTFMVGFAAALIRGQTTVMPAHKSATALHLLRDQLDGPCYVFADASTSALLDATALDLHRLDFESSAGSVAELPTIRADQSALLAFTSGSTGLPTAHQKTFAQLCANASAQNARLQPFLGEQTCLIGTVPVYHMYGFESTMWLALRGGYRLHSGTPFFAADVLQALDAVGADAFLVTTPVHLRSLVAEPAAFPQVRGLLSATAHLSVALADEAEAKFGAPLVEIYGCTEAGQLATRRTVQESVWTPYDGVTIDTKSALAHAEGRYIAGRIPLGDVLEDAGGGRFSLVGRHADLINIAGKRHALPALNRVLLAIPGVLDGSFYKPKDDVDGRVQRLAAFVHAPSLTKAAILAALAQSLDPVFLPRPLIFVASLPRNATGKLTEAALAALLAQDRGTE